MFLVIQLIPECAIFWSGVCREHVAKTDRSPAQGRTCSPEHGYPRLIPHCLCCLGIILRGTTKRDHCPYLGSLCCRPPWSELLYVVSSQFTFHFSPRHQFLRKTQSEIAPFHRTLPDSNILLKGLSHWWDHKTWSVFVKKGKREIGQNGKCLDALNHLSRGFRRQPRHAYHSQTEMLYISESALIHTTFCVITLSIIKKKNPMPTTLRSSLISLSQLPCPHNLLRFLLCTPRICSSWN